MTFREYENLQIGDTVYPLNEIENFQMVIDASNDMVTTKPMGSAHQNVFYTYNYKDIELSENIL